MKTMMIMNTMALEKQLKSDGYGWIDRFIRRGAVEYFSKTNPHRWLQLAKKRGASLLPSLAVSTHSM